MTFQASLDSKYDKMADVLYVIMVHQAAAKGIEDDNGIVWRYDEAGHAISATIMDYHEIWDEKRSALIGELAQHFSISSEDAEKALP